MALLASNSPLQGMRGLLGGLVFRSFNGKTVVSAEPYIRRVKPKDQSDRQRQTRSNFKDATLHAKTILRDERVREYYQRQAKKMKLPNAYTAAITAYMRKNKRESVNANHTGKAIEPVALIVRQHACNAPLPLASTLILPQINLSDIGKYSTHIRTGTRRITQLHDQRTQPVLSPRYPFTKMEKNIS